MNNPDKEPSREVEYPIIEREGTDHSRVLIGKDWTPVLVFDDGSVQLQMSYGPEGEFRLWDLDLETGGLELKIPGFSSRKGCYMKVEALEIIKKHVEPILVAQEA